MRSLCLAFVLVAAGCAPASLVIEPTSTLAAANARLASQDAVVVLSPDLGNREAHAFDVVLGTDTTRRIGADGPVAYATPDVARVEVFERGAKRTGAAIGAALTAAAVAYSTARAAPGQQKTTADGFAAVPVYAFFGYVIGSHVRRDRRVIVYLGPISRYLDR